jgi:DNA polymerase III delta subunit
MPAILLISGPSNAGPGERQELLERARGFLESSGIAPADLVRVDVPGRGGSTDEGSGAMRGEVEPLIPMLQSGSLFGGRQGVMLVDAQNLTAGEAGVIAELLPALDQDAVALVMVSEGSVPAVLKKVVKSHGSAETVSKIWESNAHRWLHQEIGARGLDISSDAETALIQRFGADTASLGQALDQLADAGKKVTAAMVLDRFRNRPNEPIFHYTDAVAKGDVSEALRRLSDLLIHQHPLVLLASLETELRRRSLALAAPDKETLAEWAGARPSDRWVDRVYRQRGKLKDSSLRKGLEAMVRADRVLKSAPEELHQVTLERLTVAMCMWMRGR